MGDTVFDSKVFELWLDRKTTEIISKVDKGTITSEEMIILNLKSLNHQFHQMDKEAKQSFSMMKNNIEKLETRVEKDFRMIVSSIDKFKTLLIQSVLTIVGMILAGFGGIYFKLFF